MEEVKLGERGGERCWLRMQVRHVVGHYAGYRLVATLSTGASTKTGLVSAYSVNKDTRNNFLIFRVHTGQANTLIYIETVA